MAKAFNIETALEAAGVNVSAAKKGIEALDKAFGGEAGDIPEGALIAWYNEHFGGNRVRGFILQIAKAWEAEHVAALPADRKWEREPGAAEEKARRNAEKAAKAAAKAK